ncbi:hypothetical protein OAK44_01060, partial [bacterium]|nr:hypothetical protein [bacterium]
GHVSLGVTMPTAEVFPIKKLLPFLYRVKPSEGLLACDPIGIGLFVLGKGKSSKQSGKKNGS